METTQPPPSGWIDPGQFLSEIRNLLSYLDRVKAKISSLKNFIPSNVHVCSEKFDDIRNICIQNLNSPLFGVFIQEFKNSTSGIIDDLKLKTKNYAIEIDEVFFLSFIRNLLESMNNNIFIANETKHITCSISSNSFDSTKFYIKIGDILKDSEKAVAIKKALATLRSGGDGVTSYYASIVGPSFMGKTQTAFILSHHMTVFYVNLLSTFKKEYVTLQPIYNETAEFSGLFLDTIEADMEVLKMKGRKCNAHDLLRSNISFETLGLLFVLIYDQKLNPNLSVEERFVRWCTISEVLIPKLTVRVFMKKLRGN
jgi:hypothetical protein